MTRASQTPPARLIEFCKRCQAKVAIKCQKRSSLLNTDNRNPNTKIVKAALKTEFLRFTSQGCEFHLKFFYYGQYGALRKKINRHTRGNLLEFKARFPGSVDAPPGIKKSFGFFFSFQTNNRHIPYNTHVPVMGPFDKSRNSRSFTSTNNNEPFKNKLSNMYETPVTARE